MSKIIAFDGVDGSGKSTTARLVHDYLSIDRGLNATLVNMPGATKLGQELRRIVKSKEFRIDPKAERLIFAADSAQFISEVVPAADILVCDRFSYITDLFYGHASGNDLEWLNNLQTHVVGQPIADILFLLQCPYEVSSARKAAINSARPENCRIEEKGNGFLEKVAELYNTLPPQIMSYLTERAKEIVFLDAAKPQAENMDIIKRNLERLIAS